MPARACDHHPVDAHHITLPPQSFDLEVGYQNVLDVRFVSQALSMGARCIRGARWSTQALFPQEAPGVLATAYYDYNRSFEALTMLDDVLAHVIRCGDSVTVRMAGDDAASIARAEANLREQLPEAAKNSRHHVGMEFCHLTKFSVSLNARMV